jgi:iron(III) transport system ATP-binding protein
MIEATSSTLTVKNLGKTYPGTTGGVHDASFDLKSGTFFTLLGPSGCGKTTTLRCVAGLEQPDMGSIYLGGNAFFDAGLGINVPLNHRKVGMVFQSYAIWPHLTVFENVAFPLRVGSEKHSSAKITEMVGRALTSVDLTGYEQRPAPQLSGGQQQRVALARAIVRKPALLLLDEPLSNLDALLREEMRRELKNLQQQLGVTTVYVTHDQAEALEMSDIIAVMNKGRIVQMGTPQDIYFRPTNAFVASFMGSTNVLPATVRSNAPVDGFAPVTLANGRDITCRFTRAATAGEHVAVSIRPEQISLAPAGAPAKPGTNRIEGVVKSAGFLGQAMRYEIDAGGLALHAAVSPQAVFEKGSTVTVEFAFDSALGLAIGDGDEPIYQGRNRTQAAA